MSVTAHTLRIADQLRASIDHHVDAATRELVVAWVRAWNAIAPEWSAAIGDVLAMTGDRWPNQSQLLSIERVRAALNAATTELVRLSNQTQGTVAYAVEGVAGETAHWQSLLVASQFPAQVGPGPQMLATRLSPTVLDAIVQRTTQQIESTRQRLAPDAVLAMQRSLIRGTALGQNPRATAAYMLRQTETQFNGGLARAMNIARTESLDAQRTAAGAYQQQHRDVLRGWAWLSKLDARTCPSCWARHGTEHPLDEPGPHDHQQGRCARLPLTRSWASLGIAMPEPPSRLADAEATFRALPEHQQLAILGPARLEALNSGTISWNDLSVNRANAGWRDSWVPISVRHTRSAHQARTA